MLIRLDDPQLVDDLCAHFRRSGFVAETAGGTMVDVERPGTKGHREAELEVQGLLQVWLILNPGHKAELVP